MRTLALVLLVSAPALAGCVDVPDLKQLVNDRLAPPDGYVVDCSVNRAPELWPDPCTARISWNEAPSKTEVDLAVNPRDPRNVIVGAKDLDRSASDCVWSVLYVTKDGGESWKTVYVGGDRTNRTPMLRPFSCVTDPIMVFDASGVAYYALQAYRVGVGPETVPDVPNLGRPIVGSTFILARSADGGETWDHFVPMHAGDGVGVFHDYPRMLVNPASQSVHTIWNGVGEGGVSPWVATTRDGGESVDAPVTFYAEDAPRGTAFESGFAATKDGTVYVTVSVSGSSAFTDAEGNVTEIRLFRSTDDARSFQEVGHAFDVTFTPRQLPNNEFRSPSFVEMAIDTTNGPFGDRIYTFWPDYSTGDSDVLSRFSDDGGKTWSEPVRVNANASNDQFMMRPKVGPDGTVHVIFYDRSFGSANTLIDTVYAHSKDGGASWTNVRLTNSGFDGDLGVHQNGFPFIGDYNGIDVAPDGTVHLAWGDTRTGVAEVAYARLRPAAG